MIPWNPIHRYAGMTSLFDSLDEQQPREVTHINSDGPAEMHEPTRAPLGFVDVREDAPAARDDAVEDSVTADSTSAEVRSVSATVGPVASEHEELALAVVAASDSGSEEKVPFYKREISFRRNSEPPAPVELEIVAESGSTPSQAPVDEPAQINRLHEVESEPVVSESQASASVEDDNASVASIEVESESPAATEDLPAPIAVQPQPVLAPVAEAPQQSQTSENGNAVARPTAQKKTRGGRKPSRKIVGLKIGASQLAAAVVQENDGRHQLLELARTPLEPGIVLDGEVRDADALTEALRAFFADQKLPTRDVRIGLASNRIGVRTLDIAGVDEESRFDNAVRFKAHEVLPIAMSDSVLDYRVLGERQSGVGEITRRVLLVVAPRDQVVPYVEVAQRAGLKLAGIDLQALGLLRAFVEPNVARVPGGTSTVVVAIGHRSSTLLVSGGGTCEFTRVFDWGGSTLQEAIAQELQIHPVEAETVLRHLSLAGRSRRVEGMDEDANNRALEAVRLRLTPFARELVSSLQFYQTQQDSLGIGEIVITGGTSQLNGLADALHQMIGVPVRIGNPLQRLDLSRGVESGFEQSLGSLAVAIGLGIDDDSMRSVDLSPRDLAKQKKRPNLLPILLPAAAVIPLAAAGLLFSQAHGKVSDRQEALSKLQATLATMPQPVEPQIDASLASDEAARASAVAQVLGGRTDWDSMLGDFSRVLPSNVWLTSLNAQSSTSLSTTLATPTAAPASATPATGAAALPPTPTGVTVDGYTYSARDVAVLLARLSAVRSLQNVQLQSAKVAQLGKKNVIQFTILADLRGAGGAA